QGTASRVLLADRVAGVAQGDDRVGRLDRGFGAQGCVVRGTAGLPDPLAQPGRVDELPHLAVEFDEAVDGVDGGTRDGVDDRALLAGDPVEQAGLADVRPADEGHPPWATVGGRSRLQHLRYHVENRVEQVPRTAPVQ